MFKSKAAGMYLGPRGLSIVECSQGKIKNHIYNLYPQDLTNPSGVLAPRDNIFKAFLNNEVEILAFLQKSIRDSRVDFDSDKVVVSVPTADLIVRFFEIPPIPKKDIKATVGFEIKKYIPFKTEEITYDYQTRPGEKTVEVLFAGIKNEDLDKYNSMISQLKMSISAIEPSQFSLLRLFKARKIITNKDSVVIVELGNQEGSISIIDCGLPCFSRDIKIASDQEAEKADNEAVYFRIINEVRVSIDYFRRQFLKKAIDHVIILSREESKELLDTFSKELSMPIIYKNPDEIVGIKSENSLALAKAFGASLRISKPSSLVINLAKKEQSAAVLSSQQMVSDLFSGFSDIPKATIIKSISIALVFLVVIFIFCQYKIKPFNRKLDLISRKVNSALTPQLKGLNNSDLKSFKSTIEDKLSEYNKKFVRDLFIAEKLEILPKLMPEGVWFVSISFDKGRGSLQFKGLVYRENEAEAREAPYSFITNLKSSALFSSKVSNISVRGLRIGELNRYKVVNFEINMKLSKK